MRTSSDPLVQLVGLANSRFLEVYQKAQEHEAHEVPVLVVLADKLVLVRHRGRAEYPLSSDVISTIKGVAHLPVALFVAASTMKGGRLGGDARATLAQLDSDLERIQGASAATTEEDDPRCMASLHRILTTTRALLTRLLRGGEADPATLRAFGEGVREDLRECLVTASRLQLSLLHERVSSLVHELDPWERRALQVVVVGDHQARRRSLPMQYFEKLFAEPIGAEGRVAYGEGISSVDEALALVGTRRLDVTIATTFFGDASRLHRDVLGDAAKEQLQTLDLETLQ